MTRRRSSCFESSKMGKTYKIMDSQGSHTEYVLFNGRFIPKKAIEKRSMSPMESANINEELAITSQVPSTKFMLYTREDASSRAATPFSSVGIPKEVIRQGKIHNYLKGRRKAHKGNQSSVINENRKKLKNM